MKSEILKKITACLLVITMAAHVLFARPRQAEAIPVAVLSGVLEEVTHMAFGQTVEQMFGSVSIKDYILDAVIPIAREQLVKALINSVTDWARTGGEGGDPLFVTNWEKFLYDTANDASGALIKNLGLDDSIFCSPFRDQIVINLNVRQRSVRDRFRCTLEDIVNNVSDLDNLTVDFRVGGWRGWGEIIKPNNNYISAYLNSIDAAAEAAARAKEAAKSEAESAEGFLGQRLCKETKSPSGGKHKVCVLNNPGAIIHNSLSKAVGTSFDRIITADELSELVVALGDVLLTQIISEGTNTQGFNVQRKEGSSGEKSTMPKLKKQLEQIARNAVKSINTTLNSLQGKTGVGIAQTRREIREERQWYKDFINKTIPGISGAEAFDQWRLAGSSIAQRYSNTTIPILRRANPFLTEEERSRMKQKRDQVASELYNLDFGLYSIEGTGNLTGESELPPVNLDTINMDDEYTGTSTPPVFSGMPASPVTARVGRQVQFSLDVTDPDGDDVTVTHTLQDEAVYDPRTGIFSWTPKKVGTITVTFFAFDGLELSAEEIIIEVQP